jgi:hypothetical protein
MEGETTTTETPEQFLNALGDRLKDKEGADVGLIDILKAHVLKAPPAQNAVSQAKDAIVKLAGKRANPPKPEVGNG